MEEIIWEDVLDAFYTCSVVRMTEYLGKLTIVDLHGNPIYSEEVSLPYGAIFGPDISDISYWEDICVGVIDAI